MHSRAQELDNHEEMNEKWFTTTQMNYKLVTYALGLLQLNGESLHAEMCDS